MIPYLLNHNDFFTANFFNDQEFRKNVLAKAGMSDDEAKAMAGKLDDFKKGYQDFRKYVLETKDTNKYVVAATHQWHTKVLKMLGYAVDGHPYEFTSIRDNKVVPVRYISREGVAEREDAKLMVLEIQHMIPKDEEGVDGIFNQSYHQDGEEVAERAARYKKTNWEKVFTVPEGQEISPKQIDKAISALFLLDEPQRPDYVLVLAGNMLFLMEGESWTRGAYLQLDFELLINERAVEKSGKTHLHYALVLALFGHDYLVPTAGKSIMGQLNEDNHKSAFAVTAELKAGIIHAIEQLANEAIYFFEHVADEHTRAAGLEKLHNKADDLRDDCLTIVYRLLFLFYAESRPDLGIAPMNDTVYARGYSLDILRDLELATLNGEQANNGYFFHESLTMLFQLMATGYGDPQQDEDRSFVLARLDSPLFDDGKLKVFSDVRIRNVVWQSIIRRLSLAEKQKLAGRSMRTGRISYANLGINQLGAVYESLLAFRGFFADQDYIEVAKVKKATKKAAEDDDAEDDGNDDAADSKAKTDTDAATFLVPKARRADFTEAEIRKNEKGNDIIIPKGKFVYRLSGRDRQRSASYYTPEVLTKATVKYTLAGYEERLKNKTMKAQELLLLKILEPAMGAAAFQNEVINQLAELYLRYRQHERNHRIDPDNYRHELQKVKAYIAMNNVYGVDLNPTAIELGKLSIWLNVIFPGMEAPFFGYRLGVGNAVMGCWNKVFEAKDVQLVARGTEEEKTKEWWTKAPLTLCWRKDGDAYKPDRKAGQLYHFLLPDANMAAPFANKELKELAGLSDTTLKTTKEKLKAFCQPLGKLEVDKLEKLSAHIDQLWADHYRFQKTVAQETSPRWKVYGQNGTLPAVPEEAALSYEEKEKRSQDRELSSAAYFRLRLVMDYWVALWCWPVHQMNEFPTRQQWYDDLETIVLHDVNTTPTEPAKEVQHAKVMQEATLFNGGAVLQGDLFGGAKTVELGQYRQDQGVSKALEDATKNREAYLFVLENQRVRIVRELQHQYRYFHYPLEFVEVLADRGGFDIIAGNPPWLKLEFEEKIVMAEQFPELLIRSVDAQQVNQLKTAYLEQKGALDLYKDDKTSYLASVKYLNAVQNYPLLEKQQTNLYKCILVNLLDLKAETGFAGIIQPSGIYDDPKGFMLRASLFKKLKYFFGFNNELSLFAEVHHNLGYSINIFGEPKASPDFLMLGNLFHPSTIDESFNHSGHGHLTGIKVFDLAQNKWVWNTKGHKNRVVRVTAYELGAMAFAFENTTEWEGAKLVTLHAQEIIGIIKAFGAFESRVDNYEKIISVCWDETNDQKAGNIKRSTLTPILQKLEMIYSGPHFYVANPIYKTPREKCTKNSEYDPLDLTTLPEDYVPRTNYVPATDLLNFKAQQKGFETGQDSNGKPMYDDWFGYYKLAFRKMLSQAGERTLTGAIIPPNVSHIHGVLSVTLKKEIQVLELASLTSTIVLDFFIKTMGGSNLGDHVITNFPLGVAKHYHPHLFARTLALNCLNIHYKDLWERNWQPSYSHTQWAVSAGAQLPLSEWSARSATWSWDSPLRNYYERRQALVELDVLVAMALGLNLEQLLTMYRIQFPVLQQNEHDTWYDQQGNIVFTCSKGLTGVGLDRSTWNELKASGLQAGDTYVHKISKKQSELYADQSVTYYAPFFKPDREQDYRVAWGEFEGIL